MQIEKVTLAHVTMGGDTAGCAKGLAFLELFAHLRNRSTYLKTRAELLVAITEIELAKKNIEGEPQLQ